MKKIAVAVCFLSLICCSNAYSEQDFFGIKFKNESWAKQLIFGTQENTDPMDLVKGPVLDQSVSAEASVKEISSDLLMIRITITNNSNKSISTDYHFRDFFIYDKRGERYSLVDNQKDYDFDWIPVKKSVTFSPQAGNLPLKNKDIEKIVCSFDLGSTKLVLYPWSNKEAIKKLKNPPTPILEDDAVEKNEAPATPKSTKSDKSKNSFWPWLQGKSPTKHQAADKNSQSASPQAAAPSARAVSPAATGKKVLEPYTQNIMSNDHSVRKTDVPRNSGEVVEFNKSYGFITANLGALDGLSEKSMFLISRDGVAIAQASVKVVREEISAAQVVRDTQRDDIRPGDLITIL